MITQTDPKIRRENATLSFFMANVWGALLSVILIVSLMILYERLWGLKSLLTGLNEYTTIPFLLAIGGGIVLHEGLHVLGWKLAGHRPWRDFRFGVYWLTPYAHCQAPLSVAAYRLGGFLPCLVLGLAPAAIGLWTGAGIWMIWGVLFTTAASGDLLVLWLIRKAPANALVLDHPKAVGCEILFPDKDTR